jgi:hypothetical protein
MSWRRISFVLRSLRQAMENWEERAGDGDREEIRLRKEITEREGLVDPAILQNSFELIGSQFCTSRGFPGQFQFYF